MEKNSSENNWSEKRERERETDRQTETERGRERDTHRDRGRQRERDRDSHRERINQTLRHSSARTDTQAACRQRTRRGGVGLARGIGKGGGRPQSPPKLELIQP